MTKRYKSPIFEKVPLTKTASFLFKEESFDTFDIPWHIHPEYELFHILKGSGEMVIGNKHLHFKPESVFFVGPNLPHLWKSLDDKKGIQRIVQFSYDFMGRELFSTFEFRKINTLLQKCSFGLEITGTLKSKVIKLINKMKTVNDFQRLMLLFDLLYLISESKDYKQITPPGYKKTFAYFDEERMNKIYDYTIRNFKKDISTQDISSLINMEVSAFCRYFKKRTKKTYVQFLNEVRLGQACQFLAENNLSINQIAFQCGFNNLSNFNRHFKARIGETPLEYRNSRR